jgi:methylmalonyl-CoA mutase N-terminal domain/subunit
MEKEIGDWMRKVEERGGLIQAVRTGWLESELARARVKNQQEIEKGARTVVGVNRFTGGDEPPINIHVIRPEEWGAKRTQYLRDFRARRNEKKTHAALNEVRSKTKSEENMIPIIMNALRADATLGEIHEAMRDAYGFNLD